MGQCHAEVSCCGGETDIETDVDGPTLFDDASLRPSARARFHRLSSEERA